MSDERSGKPAAASTSIVIGDPADAFAIVTWFVGELMEAHHHSPSVALRVDATIEFQDATEEVFYAFGDAVVQPTDEGGDDE